MTRAKSSYSGKSQAGGAWYDSAKTFLKNNSVISKGADLLADSGYAGKHAGTVRKIGSVAKAFGYGR
jgi:hypothetical protein